MKLIRISSILVPVIALAFATACGKKNDKINDNPNYLGTNGTGWNGTNGTSGCMSLNQGQIGFTAPNATIGMYAVYADTVTLGGGYRGNNVSQQGPYGQISINVNPNQQYGGGQYGNNGGGNGYYNGGGGNYYGGGGNYYYQGPQGVSGMLSLSPYAVSDIQRIAASYSYNSNYYQGFQNQYNNGYQGQGYGYYNNNYMNMACITDMGFNLSVGAGRVWGEAWLRVGVRGNDGQISTSFYYPIVLQ